MPTGTVQASKTPPVTTLFGTPIPERMLALRVTDGTSATLNWTMRTPQGTPVDISDLVSQGCGIVFKANEVTGDGGVFTIAGTVSDATHGGVRAVLAPTVFGSPGIYRGEFSVVNSGGVSVFNNTLLVVVDASLFANNPNIGPLTLPEIRLHLRDSSSVEGLLTDNIHFDDAEIAACIRRPVDYFNEIVPPISQRFSTKYFPYRFHWLEGTVSCLFSLAAEFYRKNNLDYQAGGASIADLKKAQEYDAAAQSRWATFKTWAQSTKVSLNMNEGWGEVASGYGSHNYGNHF